MSFNLMNISIIGITIIISLLATYLFKKASSTLNPVHINPISGAWYFLIFLTIIGTSFFMLGAEHSMRRYIRHSQSITLAWLTTLILFVIFPLIILLMQKLFKWSPVEHKVYIKKETLTYAHTSHIEFVTLLIASVVCIGAVIYTYASIGFLNSPIYNVFIGTDPDTLAKLRTIANAEFPGNQYIKNIFANALTPFISYVVYIYFRETKEKRWGIMFVLLFIASCFMALYDTAKIPIVIYVGTFLILSMYYKDDINFKHILVTGIFAFIAIVLMYRFVAGRSFDHIFSLSGPISRIIMTTPAAYILHLEVFTYRTGLLNGASMPRPFNRLIFGYDEVVRSGRVVMNTVNYRGIREGTAGVYNGLFLGEAYANFGRNGVIISSIHVPIVFFLVSFIFTRLKKTPITIALYAYLTVQLLMTMNGGYFDYFYSTIFLAVILTGLAMQIFIEVLRKFTGNTLDKKTI